MTRRSAILLSSAAWVLGVVVGAAGGASQANAFWQRHLEHEVGGVVSTNVEVAAAIRVGDAQWALTLLDGMIDNGVVSLASQPGGIRASGALWQAKVYRRVVPAEGAKAAQVAALLAGVSKPADPVVCTSKRPSALSRLVNRSGG